VLVGGKRFLVARRNLDKEKELCYSLYVQGLKYKEIGELLGLSKGKIEYYIRSWACVHSLPYPRYKGKGYFCYKLYKNNMEIKDIARLLGKKEITIYKSIGHFCKKFNAPPPFKRKMELAYRLREEKGYSYKEIAEIAGYHDRSTCFRAIKSYKKRLSEK